MKIRYKNIVTGQRYLYYLGCTKYRICEILDIKINNGNFLIEMKSVQELKKHNSGRLNVIFTEHLWWFEKFYAYLPGQDKS